MAQSHSVELYLGTDRTRLTNWDGYEIHIDMFKPGSPWTFGLWNSSTVDSAWRRLSARAQLGAPVVVEIDGAPQLNGRIEERVVKQSRAGGAVLTLSGRDLAGPAIDWDADPRTQLYGRTVDEAITALFKPLGISVVVTDAASGRLVQSRGRPGARGTSSTRRRQRVDKSRPRPGERVWQVAESIVRRLGLMMWVAPVPPAIASNGTWTIAVVIDVPDYEQEPLFRFESRVRDGVVTPESNVLESEFRASIREVPTVVHAFGRAARGDQAPRRHATGVTNTRLYDFLGAGSLSFYTPATPNPFLTSDGGVPPAAASASAPASGASVTTRRGYANDELGRWPLVVDPMPPQPRFLHTQRALNPATGQQEAARVMAAAMRHWRTYECTVQGHGQDVAGTSRLYAINTMARVRDRLAELDENMLITSVQFSGSRDAGQTTRVLLGTQGAISLVPDPES